MVTLTDSVQIKTTPEHVFNWFKNLRTGEDYRAWHPNHVDWYWIKGEPFQEGSIVYCEEQIHGNMVIRINSNSRALRWCQIV